MRISKLERGTKEGQASSWAGEGGGSRSTIDPATFREAMQLLAGGVTIVTAAEGAVRHGFTATAVMSLSDAPASIAVGLNRGGRSYGLIARTRTFCVNILTAGQRDLAEVFAGRSSVTERFAGVRWHESPHGNPAIAGALSSLDCTLIDCFEFTTHALIVASVDHVLSGTAGKPLIYWSRAFRAARWQRLAGTR